MEAKNNLKRTEMDKKAGFPIPVSSYKMILIGFGDCFDRVYIDDGGRK